jgi:hypothetical protein
LACRRVGVEGRRYLMLHTSFNQLPDDNENDDDDDDEDD